MNDSDLMVRVANGDDGAFKVLFNLHYPSIYRLCYRYLNHEQDAEEIAQDVFIRLYQSAKSYQPKAKLSTLLYRIAVNLSLNRIRDRKQNRFFSLDIIQFSQNTPINVNHQDSPDALMERQEIQQAILKSIQKLPKNQKTAVILKRYQGLTYEEIADIMQCSISAVESRLFRANQNLRKMLRSHIK